MISFYGDVRKKAGNPTYQAVTLKMRRLIDRKHPELVRIFARFWAGQSKAITYAELRTILERERAISGTGLYHVDSQFMAKWRQDYTRFVNEELAPVWRETVRVAVENVSERFPGFELRASSVREWTEGHAAEFVVQPTETQREALNALVQRSAVMQDITVDELARVIRPTVGLYGQQSAANLRFYNSVRQTYLENNPSMRISTASKLAADKAAKYAEKQHRYRAMNIARNELAVSYREGERLAVEQAREMGLLGRCIRRWVTANDECVCDMCKAMNGKTANEGELFALPKGGTTNTTQAHISCRCACEYEEIEPSGGQGF